MKNRGKGKKRTTYANLDEINQAIKDMTDEEMDAFLEEKYGMRAVDPIINDSDAGNNVIKFRPKDDKTYH